MTPDPLLEMLLVFLIGAPVFYFCEVVAKKYDEKPNRKNRPEKVDKP